MLYAKHEDKQVQMAIFNYSFETVILFLNTQTAFLQGNFKGIQHLGIPVTNLFSWTFGYGAASILPSGGPDGEKLEFNQIL